MKISELIQKLESLKANLGDVPVVVAKDTDNGEEIPLVEADEVMRMNTRKNNREVVFICGT
jgi:hypothetical protein